MWVWVAWLGLSVVGATLIGLPDSGPRLSAFNDDHGPDAVGAVIATAGWLVLDVQLFRARARPADRVGRRGIVAGAAVAAGDLGLLVASLGGDWSGAWWAVGSGVLAAPQLAAAAVVSSTAARTDGLRDRSTASPHQ